MSPASGGLLAGSPKYCARVYPFQGQGYRASPAAGPRGLRVCWREINGLMKESGLRETGRSQWHFVGETLQRHIKGPSAIFNSALTPSTGLSHYPPCRHSSRTPNTVRCFLKSKHTVAPEFPLSPRQRCLQRTSAGYFKMTFSSWELSFPESFRYGRMRGPDRAALLG